MPVLCKDCNWFKDGEWCQHSSMISLVTGEPELSHCITVRADKSLCGPEGRGFMSKAIPVPPMPLASGPESG